ncbi:MAG: serpin family protein [Chlorobi bacterium]|nr:serpin family protein [Chlorobiota bacterium]
MKKYVLFLIFVFAVNILNSQNKTNIIESNNKFTFELFSMVADEQKNIFLSPFSVSAALAMTYEGARGKTRKEMSEVLHFPENAKEINESYKELISKTQKTKNPEYYLFNIANSVWAQKDFNFLHSYFETVKSYYDAQIEGVDFRTAKDREIAVKKINDWTAKKTKNKIKNLLDNSSVDGDTKMVLVNAVYFLAQWDKKFNEKATQKDIFYALNGKTQKEFMYVNNRMKYAETDKFKMVEIPYKGKRASMIIVLPEKSYDFSLFEKEFGYDDFKNLYEKSEYKNIKLAVPKFKTEYKTDLAETLYSAGMKHAFTNRADFSGMTCKKELRIDKVIHQTFINIDESGTEAAAATAVIMKRITSVNPSGAIEFKADRPFLYFIKDNTTGSILFMGKLAFM